MITRDNEQREVEAIRTAVLTFKNAA